MTVGTMMTRSPEETMRMGEMIGEMLEPGDIVALTGELGAGKTCLTQGIARGLGISPDLQVTSPTFTLINEYPGGRIKLFHLDTYRLSGPADLEEMGYEDYFFSDHVMVIEWAEKIKSLLPDTTIYITMTYRNELCRDIEIAGHQEKCKRFINALHEGGFE